MATKPPTAVIELDLKLRISREAQEKLGDRAARSGRDVAEYASALIERAVAEAVTDDACPSGATPPTTAGAAAEHLPAMREHFQHVGHGRGRLATAGGREEEYRFWRGTGSAGAGWLIKQLATAGVLRRLWGIANILSAIGPAAVEPVLDALAGEPTDDEADALLSALSGIEPAAVASSQPRLVGLLRRYHSHPDDAVRSKAAGATRLLHAADARAILEGAMTREADPDVREAIADELQRLRS